MNRKNYKRHLAYEVLVVLCMTAAVLFICRLWPLLLLVLLALPGVLAWLIISCRSAVEPGSALDMEDVQWQSPRLLGRGCCHPAQPGGRLP